MAEEQITIKMTMTKDEFATTGQRDPVQAAKSLDPELRWFDQWMMSKDMEPLSTPEREIIREYLGAKLMS